MLRRAILQSFRSLCLICFGILVIAAIVAILELVTGPALLKATGCSSTEILPLFTCGDGWVNRSMEIVLSLPLLFFYAIVFTVFTTTAPPGREFMLLLYLFDVILILALTYLLLILLKRKSSRPGS
jgi:hypothetical protein